MSIFGALARAFTPLDTSEAEAAIAAAARSQRDIAVRTRALRMDLSCGDPIEAIEKLTGNVRSKAAHALRAIFDATLDASIPDDLQWLLDRLD